MGGKGSGRNGRPPAEMSSKIAGSIMEILSWEKPSRKDIPALRAAFGRYIQHCMDTGLNISNMNAYLAMGIDRDTAYNWEHGRNGTPEHAKLIREVKLVCASFREQAMAEGGINPVTGIWWQKNYDGLKDVQEVVSIKTDTKEQYSIEDIQKKYALPESDVGGTPDKK